MSLEEYQAAWRAGDAQEPLREELDGLVRRLNQAERRRRIVLGICAFNTAAAFVLVLSFLFSGRAIAWNEAAPVLGLQVFLAAALALLIRRRAARQRELEMSGRSVLEAARTGLSNVASEIRDIRLMALAGGVAVPVLAFVVGQLIVSGKMNAQAAWGFTLVCLAVIGANAVYPAWRYRRTLAPRRARLEQIMESLSETA